MGSLESIDSFILLLKEGVIIKTFIIQTIDKQVVHDFSFHLIEAIKYNNWYNDEKVYDYFLQDTYYLPLDSNNEPYKEDVEGIIPVGSVEFVLEYLKRYHNISNVKPINIPLELMNVNYLNRRVFYENEIDDIPYLPTDIFFIKSADKIKGYKEIIRLKNIPQGHYIISDLINIDSEWRAFVFNDNLVGLQNYQGEFTIFPDVDLIQKMIFDYKGKNPAYTLDIGINQEGTFLIEVHDFFSCGLYGFNDYIALPRMFIATWNKLINQFK